MCLSDGFAASGNEKSVFLRQRKRMDLIRNSFKKYANNTAVPFSNPVTAKNKIFQDTSKTYFHLVVLIKSVIRENCTQLL